MLAGWNLGNEFLQSSVVGYFSRRIGSLGQVGDFPESVRIHPHSSLHEKCFLPTEPSRHPFEVFSSRGAWVA